MTSIEKALNAILEIPIIRDAVETAQIAAEAAQTVAEAAQVVADTAQTAANNAQWATDAQALESSLVNSYVDSTIATPTADSFGNITVVTHQRVYGNPALNPTVSVAGATFPAAVVPGDVVRVYYSDPARAGGTVTYQYTVDGVDLPPVQGNNIHSVGAVEIPVTGTGDGVFLRPPGYIFL